MEVSAILKRMGIETLEMPPVRPESLSELQQRLGRPLTAQERLYIEIAEFCISQGRELPLELLPEVLEARQAA